jgi:predicted DNA-binding transcriptional regulator AlpA
MPAYAAIAARAKPDNVLPPIAVSEADAARAIGVCPRTLWTLRKAGRGPRHVVIGSSIRYRVDAIHEWLASQERIESAPATADDGGAS